VNLACSPLGALLTRPWLDRAGLIGLRRWYLPLSRLWAAANASGNDVARFREEAGLAWPEGALRPLLARHTRLRDAAQSARDAWEEQIFAGTQPTDEGVRLLDQRRRAAATRHMGTRLSFYPLLFPHRPPLARWEIDRPNDVTSDLADALAKPDLLYAVAIDLAALGASHSTVKGDVREYWLRGPTPSPRLRRRRGSEVLYARVVEPADGSAHATLVFGSGLGLELELMDMRTDSAARLAGMGWRVVEPISPYHGLRAMPGRYGGEPFFGAGPTGSIDLIAGQAVESALLVAWSRTRFGGSVALAGISMTSFVAQQVASRCHLWPPQARPDAVMLISHSGRIGQATLAGELALQLGLDRALAKAGWSAQSLADLSQLVDPLEEPALPVGRIVSVLGKSDRWLPYSGGLDIAQRWRLPAANMFSYPVGHLGMPLQLARDPGPLERLKQVLRAG
jgi:hypothetical protein